MEQIILNETSLLIVDAQRGFSELCPEELPILGGLAIIPALNQLLALPWARIDASQDWHPVDHCSFLGQRDNLYPPHCVMGTPGADFLPGLHTERFHAIWRKGYYRDRDAYALTAQHPAWMSLLWDSDITTVVIAGLATNICCFFVARDLCNQGFSVFLVEDASAGIDVPAAGLFQDKTRKEAIALGIQYYSVQQILQAIELTTE
jgi:nicotinamidase/pyrazinamidase